MTRRYALALSLVLAGGAAGAQTTGDCALGMASDTLRVNDVAAPLMNRGLLFENADGEGAYHGYRVAGENVLYNASLWVGGRVGGDLRVAGSVWGYEGFEFWPGPLDEGATLPDPTDCSAYDRIWTVSVEDVAAYEAGGAPAPDLAAWPVGLGAVAVDASGAPVAVTSRDQTVDLAAGERPVIYGSQTAFWVMNDVGNTHRVTGSAPLGIEVAVTAFAVASDDLALDRSMFVRYAITNRNRQPIEDAYVSFYADPDLGSGDYTGADTLRNMGFAYHAADPERAGPRALGVDLLGGSADGEPRMDAFVYFGGSAWTDVHPTDSATEFYRVMRGFWPDGAPMVAVGDGYGGDGEATTIALPGDPVTGQFWSDENTGEGRGDVDNWDRRFVLSTGSGTMAPGQTWTVDLGILFALGPDRLGAVTALREVSDLVQGRYDDGSLFESAPIPGRPQISVAPSLGSPADGEGPLDEEVTLEWAAVAGATEYDVQWSRSATFDSSPDAVLLPTTSWTGTIGDPPKAGAIFWRVRARRGRTLGPYSDVRSFQYDGARSQLPAVLGVVEVRNPAGSDPCGPTAGSRGGCPLAGEPPTDWEPGNSVYFLSSNSTGEYSVYPYGGGGSLDTLGAFAPNDFEIRFVPLEEGAYAYDSGGHVTQVPFQVWDIGSVAPGEENDPADDVQLVPVLDPFEGVCSFEFDGPTITGDDAVTPRISAYYPAADDYAAWAAVAAPLAARCGRSTTAPDYIDFERGRPIQRDVIVPKNGTVTVADLEGAVVRYYTRDDVATAGESRPTSGGVALGAPFPNPTLRRSAVPYEVPVPGPVRLVVYDVLGREAAVLIDEDRPSGLHEAHLDASRMAAGAYVLVLTTPSGRAVRTLTVAR